MDRCSIVAKANFSTNLLLKENRSFNQIWPHFITALHLGEEKKCFDIGREKLKKKELILGSGKGNLNFITDYYTFGGLFFELMHRNHFNTPILLLLDSKANLE